jgi:hypothetical protein
MITAVLDLERATRSYMLESMRNRPFLSKYWEEMVEAVEARADVKPEWSGSVCARHTIGV